MDNKQIMQFAFQLQTAVGEAFENEESMAHIDASEVEEYTTEFITALACVMPAMIYQKLTGDENGDYLAFNHIANRLCMQLAQSVKDDKNSEG